MPNGLAFAIEELPLAVFTALAPAGAVCMIALMAMALAHRFTLEGAVRLSQLTWIPLSVTTVALIAAAAHLGTPANALYVIAGVGRSPLSNEVVSAVVFLMICGVNWLLSFVRTDRLAPKRALAVLIIAAGLVFLALMALAYDVETIVSWASPFTPASILLGGLAGGCLLASLVVSLVEPQVASPALKARLVWGFFLAAAAHVAVLAAQWVWLGSLAGPYGTAAQFAAPFPLFIGIYAVAVVAALALTRAAKRFEHAADCLPEDTSASKRAFLRSFALLFLAAATVLVRFGFYMSHMTIGLGA